MLLACGAQGCISTTPQWDSQFGAATRANLAAQTIHPAAGASRNPAAGLDGRAARAAIDNYERSFAPPAPGPPAPKIRSR
ncbi:MAG: hypothetical protein RR763_17675 [Massilia sp.]